MTYPQPIDANASPEVQMNENLEGIEWAGCFSLDPTDTDLLDRAYNGGRWAGLAISDVTHTFGASVTTYVAVNRTTGALNFSTSNTNFNDTGNYARVEVVVTNTTQVSGVTDYRGGPGGVHGGGNGGGIGALTNFAEALATASPNNVDNAASLTPAGASATNTDFVIKPKGNGAILAQVPDGTSTAGNRRGTNAVDFQILRSTAAQVASGARAFAAGSSNTASGSTSTALGSGNTASGSVSFAAGSTNSATGNGSVAIGSSNNVGSGGGQNQVAIGNNNTVTASNTAVAIGDGNASSGTRSVAMGSANTASATDATAIGTSCTASAADSLAMGFRAITRAVVGIIAKASGRFAADGDAQGRELYARASTTNNTPTVLTSDQAAAGSTNQLTVPSDSAIAFEAQVVARQNSTADCARWTVKGLIKSNGATVSLVGSPIVTLDFNDAGAAAWALAVTADNTNKAVTFTVTGETSKTIRWVAKILSAEVLG